MRLNQQRFSFCKILRRLISGFSLFASLAGAMIASCIAVAAPAKQVAAQTAKRPLILVHYMPWFSARPSSEGWGWHWSMNAFDPEKTTDGKRSIASHYYPLIGPYDSGDPTVIEYHLLLMKLAGIDGLIVDWYGLENHFDYRDLHRNSTALLQMAEKLGLRFGICCEDQTIPQLVAANKLPAANRAQHATQEIEWLRKNWFVSPAYLKLDGKPVLLSFGHNGLSDGEWEQVLTATRGPLLYLSEHRRRSTADGAFDWPVPQEGFAALDRFYAQSNGWPVAMPVAFPRFHDIYAEAKVHASWGRIADDGGQTFVRTLRRALQSGAPLVQIATWNDWGEGTIIEPSQAFRYRDLETLQRLRRNTIDPRFSFQPDDLRLIHRLFLLRHKAGQPFQTRRELDKIAQLLAAGSLSKARTALDRLESAPVMKPRRLFKSKP